MRSQTPTLCNLLTIGTFAAVFAGWMAGPQLAAQEILPLPDGMPAQEIGLIPDDSQLPIVGQDTDVIEGTTPLPYGPMHEAFAERFNLRNEAAMVVSKEPPAEIEEQPAELPAGSDPMEWIPGYWGWDIEREDYVWVSGIWRRVPADQHWIAGYWTEVDGGWQRVSGFWDAELVETVHYLPTPPENIDNGPSMLAPTDDAFWIPGCWQYANTGFVWRSGYWQAARENWVWVPARYIWTPYGYVFRQGYWDYALDDRGILFVPIVVDPGFHGVYRPSYCVDVTPNLFSQLYVVSGCGSYYLTSHFQYGGRRQVYSWVNCHQHGFDPLYHYYSHQGKSKNWMKQISQMHHQIVASAPKHPHVSPPGIHSLPGNLHAGNNLHGKGNLPPQGLAGIKVTKVGAISTKPTKPSRMPSGVNRTGPDSQVSNRKPPIDLPRRFGEGNGASRLGTIDIPGNATPGNANRSKPGENRTNAGRPGVTDPLVKVPGKGSNESSKGSSRNGANRNGTIEIPNGSPRNGGQELLNGMNRNGANRNGTIEIPNGSPRNGGQELFNGMNRNGTNRNGTIEIPNGVPRNGGSEFLNGMNRNGANRNGTIEIPNGVPRNGGNEFLNGMNRNGANRNGTIEHPTFRPDRNSPRSNLGGQAPQVETHTPRSMSPTFRANKPQNPGDSGANRSGASQNESRRSGKR